MKRVMRNGSILIQIDDSGFDAFEKIVEKCTGGDGHHTMNYIGNGMVTEALLNEGVVMSPIEKHINDTDKMILVLEPRDSKFSDIAIDLVVERWKNDIGKKYDKWSAVAKYIPLFRKYCSQSKLICSEHTARGYENLHNFMKLDPEDVTPNDILKDQLYTCFAEFRPFWLR
jgi:hypothetical protein